jgi:hypothetical protein
MNMCEFINSENKLVVKDSFLYSSVLQEKGIEALENLLRQSFRTGLFKKHSSFDNEFLAKRLGL